MMKNYILATLVLSVIACGQKPLSEEQKQIVKESMMSLSTATSTSSDAGANIGPGSLTNSPASATFSPSGMFANAVISSESKSKAKEIVQKALKEKKCKVSTNDTSEDELSVNIDGSGCPLHVSTKVSSGSTPNEKNASFDLTVMDPELKNLIELSKLTISANTSVVTASDHQSASMKLSMDMNADFSKHGAMKSNWEVTIDMRAGSTESEINISGNIKGNLNFEKYGFTAVLEVNITDSNKSEYYLNGEKLTPAQVKDFFNEGITGI